MSRSHSQHACCVLPGDRKKQEKTLFNPIKEIIHSVLAEYADAANRSLRGQAGLVGWVGRWDQGPCEQIRSGENAGKQIKRNNTQLQMLGWNSR